MRPPPFAEGLFPHITREAMEASFQPCCYCGEREREITTGVYKIFHDYSKHPGMTERPTQRMSTEELMRTPNPDFTEVLSRKEA